METFTSKGHVITICYLNLKSMSYEKEILKSPNLIENCLGKTSIIFPMLSNWVFEQLRGLRTSLI